MNACTILLFVRWPEPGRVKTRLAATMGAEEACRVYRALAQQCFAAACSVAGARVVVCGTGAAPEAFRHWLQGAADYWEQPNGDLGARLETMFRRAFDAGAQRVAAIGSDTPGLGGVEIAAAMEALGTYDVTLVPAADGGYVLIGTRRHLPELFEGMPWSSDALLARTLAVCAQRGLSAAQGPPQADIDTEEDWRNFSGRNEPSE
ncbi:MAG: uncharacterized protein PWP23_2934 [Candidatus Sumerlaeota bacterium]|nr:uncharacterized protein [Candidatus Sumerlaeota bacterium]